MHLHRRFLSIFTLILLLFLLRKFFSLPTKSLVDSCRTNAYQTHEKFYLNLVYINELKILFCDVPKAASSNLRRLIYVYFNQSISFENLDRNKIWLDEKQFFNRFYLQENHPMIYRNKTIFKFLLVRHPFQRIYSTFYDKFVSNQIEDTISGWKQLEENILIQMNPNESLLNIRRNDFKVDLRTFLLFIIESIRNNQTINSHWEQITQRCGICAIDYDWIGKIENFEEDQKILLKKFPKLNLQFPSKTFDQRENPPPQLNHPQLIQLFRNTIQNDQLFQILLDYYQPDFHLFHYSFTEG